jgi:hypothetical protein
MALGVMALVATAGTAKADDPVLREADGPDVIPTQHDGNPTCKTLLDNPTAFEIKIDPPKDGTYGPITVDFSDDLKTVYFKSTVPVLAVFVKGGNQGGNLYDYRPLGEIEDDGLTTPTNQQISHVSFCWNEEPTPPKEALKVTKTAEATYDRKITWDLTKTVDDNEHSGTAGQTAGTSNWKVEATKTATDSNFKVTGVITITNPNSQAVGFSVTDKLDDPAGTMATVDCSSEAGNQDSGTVPANGTTTCDYTASPTTKDATSNNVQVSSTTQGVPGATALADVTWQANVIGDEEVELADEHLGYKQTIKDTTSFDQDETFKCSDKPADYTDGKYSFKVPNTATLKGVTTDLSDSAEVNVDCTLAALTATKTANGSFDRTIKWALTKTVAPQGPFSGNAGDSFNYTWKVDATKTVTENSYKVTGKITVTNPAAIAQTFSVADELDDGTVATVTCPSLTVPAKGSVECSYTAASAKNATKNTATVKAAGNADVVATAGFSYTANVIGDEKVTLGDTSPKDTPPINFSQEISDSTTKEFPKTFTCPTDPTKYTNFLFTQTNTNTATLTGPNTTVPPATASVTFNCKYPWRAETATGDKIFGGGPWPGSNWFMYTSFPLDTTTKTVNLIAGQKYDAGDIKMSRSGGYTYIEITLHNGFRWANVKENLKIQPLDKAPTKYMQPGSFTNKFTVPQLTVTYTAKVPTKPYYGIHADVERFVN